jgi:sensor histidine kinase YesM
VEVKNTGRLPSGPLKDGIGLQNIKARLQLLFKDKASFQLREDDGYVVATIKIAP